MAKGKWNKGYMCKFQPDNIGLKCENVTEMQCAKCGWNPAVEAERRAKLKENKTDNV